MTHEDVWKRDVHSRGLALNRWSFTELVSDLARTIRRRDFATVVMPLRIAHERLGAASVDRCDPRMGDLGTLPWPDGPLDVVEERFSVNATREPVL
jgi:hypothetical protein